jgi:DNA-binding response OmpR family regulator
MPTASTPPAHVIIVEDNEALREAMAEHLMDEGYLVRAVADGAALDQALHEAMADVLILDINLPIEDGYTISKRIRASFPTIGIMILSARVQTRDTQSQGQAADMQLAKPLAPQVLSEAIRHLCQIAASRRLQIRPAGGPQPKCPHTKVG